MLIVSPAKATLKKLRHLNTACVMLDSKEFAANPAKRHILSLLIRVR